MEGGCFGVDQLVSAMKAIFEDTHCRLSAMTGQTLGGRRRSTFSSPSRAMKISSASARRRRGTRVRNVTATEACPPEATSARLKESCRQSSASRRSARGHASGCGPRHRLGNFHYPPLLLGAANQSAICPGGIRRCLHNGSARLADNHLRPDRSRQISPESAGISCEIDHSLKWRARKSCRPLIGGLTPA